MTSDKFSHKWRPLEDLPADRNLLASSELPSLSTTWAEQREHMDEIDVTRFNERLTRQWAIETGVIEDIYTLDRGVTQLLIEGGIDASQIPHDSTDIDPVLLAAMIGDHESAMGGLFDFVSRQRLLSTSFAKELHQLITHHQKWCAALNTFGRQTQVRLDHGEYKRTSNNPTRPDGRVHEYCPPEQVASEMDRLINLHLEHQRSDTPPEVEASWLHHRFAQIHPFQDGNGRVARALASLIFIRAGWFPLVVTRDDRKSYIESLEAADGGDLTPLIYQFTRLQRDAFIAALSIGREVEQRRRVHQTIAATRDLLRQRRVTLLAEWDRAKEVARSVHDRAIDRLEELSDELDAGIGPELSYHKFFVDDEQDDGHRTHYFRNQIIQSAQKLGYFASPDVYAAWTRLVLRSNTQAEILLSIHGIGHEYRGLLGCSLTFFRRMETDQGDREVSDTTTVCTEVFQINYVEDTQSILQRFDGWLDEGLFAALEVWRSGL